MLPHILVSNHECRESTCYGYVTCRRMNRPANMPASEHRTYARTGTSRQLFDGQTVAAAARKESPTAHSQAASDLMDRSRPPPDGRARRGAPRRDGPSSARQVEQREQEVVEQVGGLRVVAAHARPTPDSVVRKRLPPLAAVTSCGLPLEGGEDRLESVHLTAVRRERHQDRGGDASVAPLLDPFADACRRTVQSAIR